MNNLFKSFSVSLMLLISQQGYSQELISLEDFEKTGQFSTVKPIIQERNKFYGLAGYYNRISFHVLNNDVLLPVDESSEVTLQKNQKFVSVGRYNILLVESPGSRVDVTEQDWKLEQGSNAVSANLISKKDIGPDSEYSDLLYSHLWSGFAIIAKAVQWSLSALQSFTGMGWGLTIVLFAVLLKITLLPVGTFTNKLQVQADQIQRRLAPLIQDIRSKYEGEEAHNRILAAHKELGVSSFYRLRPLLGTLIQVPIWIAVFNALGEMPQLTGERFLWIADLSYPDAVARLPFAIPLIGNTLNLLPLLMTIVTIASALLTRELEASHGEMKSSRRNLYIMAAGFLVLFYPFPAAMVLYWTISNLSHLVAQRMRK